jgi:lipid-A-disaccharide synthase
MKYYIIAGEASGDLHAGNCMREIIKLDPLAEFAFTGGDLMEEVSGKKADVHIKKMAFMGFIDVLKNLGKIKANFKTVKQAILNFKPDVLLLVDYPGFNLRMAKWATEKGIRVDYYVSPTVWAWKEGRVEEIRKYTNKLFVILPFEEAFYAKHNHKVYFVGHPLLDAIKQQKPTLLAEDQFRASNKLSARPLIAVLPGSREQEISRMLGVMLKVIPDFSGYEFVIAGSKNLPQVYYDEAKAAGIRVVFDQTYELMSYAKAGIIKSGTSTLESALFKLPQVVCYKGGAVSFAIGKRLVNVKYISLVNLIMDAPIVKELIQNDFTAKNISSELDLLLNDAEHRGEILRQYDLLVRRLGGGGASARVASHIHYDAHRKN